MYDNVIQIEYMRKAITISLPEKLYEQLLHEVKTRGFASTSEFVRRVVREWLTEQANLRYLQEQKVNKLRREIFAAATTDLD